MLREYDFANVHFNEFVSGYLKSSFTFQQVAFKNLVERNREREKREGGPAPNSAIQVSPSGVHEWVKSIEITLRDNCPPAKAAHE